MNAGIARVGAELDAQADRRPRRRLHAEMGQRRQHLLAVGLQGVDAQIERRAARHRGRLRHPVIAEHLRQIGIEPFRIVAGDVRGRVVQGSRGQRRAFGLGQRLRREPAAVAQRGDGVGIEPALELQHAQHPRPRRVGVHDPGAGGAPAQHVPDQARDRGAIAGAGIAMRGAPLLQRLRRGNAVCVDGADQFDGGGQPRCGSHSNTFRIRERVRSTTASSARSRATSRTTPARRRTTPSERCRTSFEVTKMPAWTKRVTTNTQDSSTMTRSAWRSGSASAIRT